MACATDMPTAGGSDSTSCAQATLLDHVNLACSCRSHNLSCRFATLRQGPLRFRNGFAPRVARELVSLYRARILDEHGRKRHRVCDHERRTRCVDTICGLRSMDTIFFSWL